MLYLFVLTILWICSPLVKALPWLLGPCSNASDFYKFNHSIFFENATLTDCLDACTAFSNKKSISRSDFAIWNQSQKCLCFSSDHVHDLLKLLDKSCYETRHSKNADVQERSEKVFVLLLQGPTLHDINMVAESNGKDVSLKMTASVREEDSSLNSRLPLRLEIYWFVDGRLVSVDTDIEVDQMTEHQKIESKWNTTLETLQNSTAIRVVLNTKLATQSLTRSISDLLYHEPENHPCVPTSYETLKSGLAEFCNDDVIVYLKSKNMSLLWIFPNNESSGNSTKPAKNRKCKIYFVICHSTTKSAKTTSFTTLVITLNNITLASDLNSSQSSQCPALFLVRTKNELSCQTLSHDASFVLSEIENGNCLVTFSNKTQHYGQSTTCQVYAKLESVTIRTNLIVATQSPTRMIADVQPECKCFDCQIHWSVLDENGTTIFNSSSDSTRNLVYTFLKPGLYRIRTTAANRISEISGEVSILTQDPITKVNIVSPKPISYLVVQSTVQFLAAVESSGSGGEKVQCSWKLQCLHYSSSFKVLNHTRDIKTCNISQRFASPTLCTLSLTVFNRVSRLELPQRLKIIVEEPVSVLQFYVPAKLATYSPADVVVFVKTVRQSTVVVTVDSVAQVVSYDGQLRAYRSGFVPDRPGVKVVRLKVSNNVSSVVLRKNVLVLAQVGPVDIVNVGCSAVGLPLRFLILINGTVPSQSDTFLYHWSMGTEWAATNFYTSVPVAESEIRVQPGDVKVTVRVSNGVSSSSASTTVNIREVIPFPCLNHVSVIELGQPMDFEILGLSPGLLFGNVSLHVVRENYSSPPTAQWKFNISPSAFIRWRYLSQSTGFHGVMGFLFFELSDRVATSPKLFVRTGYQVVRRLHDLRIYAPRTVYLTRFPATLKWRADVKPHSEGCVFYWKLHGHKYVTATPQLTVELHYPPGIYHLDLEVRNALGDRFESSMVFEVATTLLLLNYTLSNFFVHQNGTISLEINQPTPPDALFVDFGDETTYDSNYDPGLPIATSSSNESSVLTLYHTYRHPGPYDVYVNATSMTGAGFDQWMTVVVEEKMAGVELLLLSNSPVVELLEEVMVVCSVRRGTNLQFRWDFGDGTDGEQYTRQDVEYSESRETKCIAHHSYGIANSYNVSVRVSNSYESHTAYLDVGIRAVEPIVELHLHPRIRGRYAAPLYTKNKQKKEGGCPSTLPVEFEAGVWRGSDVQFTFDFGDGSVQEELPSLLNAWSHPYAVVKHSYTSEGSYDITVRATNLLSSVNASLGRPFYVQFPPENLVLDKQYYIIERHSNLTLRASISQGTNVSYNWKVGDMQLTSPENTLYLASLQPGIYIVTVEAFNHVTDYGYSVMRRPNATAKIYVQEKLLDIQICVKTNIGEICNPRILDLPLEEEVEFRAKVIPSTETVLRFIWQLGKEEIRRTNVPVFTHKYQQAKWYSINVTAQNHISSISSISLQLNLVQRVGNLTSIFCQGPNLVKHPITYRAFYWFGTNLTFQWDFGDGSLPLLTTSSSVQHTYNEVGEYWVTVNVWNKFSKANITTNMFFLHHVCQKPEITFLHQRTRIARHDIDILIEADVSVICKTANVEYIWTVKEGNGRHITLDSINVLNHRQLVIPKYFLKTGTYTVYLKVKMIGTIVYAESSTQLEIVLPHPVLYIGGGFVQWVGADDSRKLAASVMNFNQANHTLQYEWSCIPQIQKHLPCFKNSEFLQSNLSPELYIPSSEISPSLESIIINVTSESNKLLSTTQLLEIKPVPHMLHVSVECEQCHDHHINPHEKLLIKASCQNCGYSNLEYQWKIWIIEDGKFRLHFGNYECVQADGSTFFIMAPNSTQEESFVNVTYLPNEDLDMPLVNASTDHMLAEKPYEDITEDLPPFPNLPGFPEENGTAAEQKLSRNARSTFDEDLYESPDLIPISDYPYEGDANYDDNSNFTDYPYPDFMPFPVPGSPLEGPDYLITEEGLPGESGSAAARHQSSQHLGIILSEDEDQILEEAGKPRMKTSGTTNVLPNNPNERGDPFRDRFSKKMPAPHIVSRPRGLLTLDESFATTGFNSEYLILRPGVLKVGRSYLVQAKVRSSGNDLEGFAMEYFRVSVGPVNGRCTLMPLDGYSINFDYRLHCLEWKSDHFPLYYELSYSRNPDDLGHLIYFGLNENVKFNLPSGFASDAHNIYLNVLVRDSLGVPTKVCSIVRTVKPLSADVQVEHIVYNETFHPKASLKKLIGEKNNQAVLQKLHVLASSLNNYDFSSTDNKSDPEFFSIRSKIRQEFFEIINGIQISSKVEAAQLISVLNQIVADFQTIKLFELQKAYNLYEKINDLQLELYNFFASDHMHYEFMNFLSKLAFASHFILPQNDELIEIARTEVIHQMKQALKTKLTAEEPSKVDIPHLTAASLYVTEDQLVLKPFIALKNVAVQFLNNSYLISKIEKKASKRCDYDECLAFVVQEYDYIAPSPSLYISNVTKAASSVLLSLNSFDHFEEENITLNVSVQFLRQDQMEERNKITLMGNYMNVHTINITEKHIRHSLLFHIQLESINATEDSKAVIDIMFRHLNHPTLTKYDLKKSFPAISTEATILIPPERLKEPGLYYISVLSRDFQEKKPEEYVMWEYEVSLRKDVCLGKVAGFWSVADCYVMETTNHNSTHCKCSSHEITAFSAPVEWELSWVPVGDLIEPYFNPLPLLVFLVLLFLYFLLVYLNLKKDKLRHLPCSPVSLKDNSNKHKQLYLICVKTGFYFSSGTTASVYIVLHGTKDVTETRQLIGKNVTKLFFQKGSVDVFLLSTERSLGPLLKLEVWHDNEGTSPSWYLKEISVKDLNSGSTHIFNCYNWLSAEREDGQIERELAVAENKQSFIHVFYENLIVWMNDFNMWNALALESPTSFFTGVQRITCCLCFILNSAVLILLFTSMPQKAEKDNLLPNLAITTLIVSAVAALIATVPQTLYIILLRFSKQPFVDVNPKFVDLFHWLCPCRLKCRLKPKRSTSSRSTGDRSSSSIEGSDSLYSTFENSSIISVQESFTVEEKDVLPLSYSYSDLSDPVSPLQNTLSTWQTLENWLKKKQSLILNPEAIPMKRRSYVSEGEISFNSDQDSEDSQTWQQSSALVENSNTESSDIVSMVCQDMNEDLNLNCFFPYMHQGFYYVGWFTLIANIFGSTIFVLMKISRFSIPHSVLLLKITFISSVCSCVVIIPIIILLFSFFFSIWSVLLSRKQKVSIPVDNSEKDKRSHKVDLSASSYSRVEYFKKYLRPPKEEILEQFRQIAIQEKRICHFYSGAWNFAIVLILLVAASYPGHSHMKYLQKSSIENALFRSIPKGTKIFSTKNSLLGWLESDFLDGFLADHQCFNVDEDCGMSTKCIFVGSVILRHFYSSDLGEISNSSLKLSNNFGNVYERRKLRGFYGIYHVEDEWQVLSDQMFYVYDEMQDFVEKLNASSAGSLEFLLFNPTFSTFVSVSLLFEMTSLGATYMTHEILPVVISSSNSFSGYLKLFFNLILFIFMLFGIKNQIWKMIKHKSQHWKQMWSHWSLLFIFVYFIYVSFFVLHIVQCDQVLSVLINTQLNSNVNTAEVVMFENALYVSVGILMFIHIIGCLEVLSFNHRLKKMLKRLMKSQKKIFITILSLFVGIVPFIVMIKYFIGSSLSFSHPLFGLFELALSIFKDFKKPEIIESESPIKQFLSIFTSLTLICVHVCLFSFIRSVLLHPHPIDDNWREKCTLKSTKNVIRNKFLAHFKPCSSKTASKVKYVPPVDILLFELERIADVLVTKVNNLFPEDCDDECFSKSECELDKNELKMGTDIIADILETCAKLDDRLISTMPRRTKGNLNTFLPSSFHASLGSEKKYQTLEMSSSLSQSKIRKTYPLFSHLDSDSTISGTSLHELEGKLDSVNSLSVRKTKSRGKNEDFELNIEASDNE